MTLTSFGFFILAEICGIFAFVSLRFAYRLIRGKKFIDERKYPTIRNLIWGKKGSMVYDSKNNRLISF